MPWRLLSTSKQLDTNSDSFQTSNDDEDNAWHELTIGEYDSLLTSLNHICTYWREIVIDKIRFLLTVVYVTMFNIARRLTPFARQKPVTQSTASITTSFQEDLNCSSPSFINFNSHIDLPSIETSPMAHILVQQQTPNISIHQSPTTNNENLSPTAHSFDERLYFYKPDSTCWLEFLQRFASESHLSKYQTKTNNFVNKNLCSKTEDHYDRIQPVVETNQLDNTSSTTPTIDDIDEDVLLNVNSTLTAERYFRRRKRHLSLTKTSPNDDKTEPVISEKVDDNNNNTNTIENDDSQSISTDEKEEQTAPSNHIRGRRFRFRACRRTPDNTIESSIPTEIPTPISPPLTPPPPVNVNISQPFPNPIAGGLRRTNSVGDTKKAVRFADSVGRELAQVQYIQSPIDDDDDVDDANELKELSFGKNGLYLPKTSHIEHKPWSFDVALSSKQISDNPVPRRFFCLYRQPNSEHPDIYLHEVWKSQIKLEHAEVRLKSPLTGEQCLHGTIWVTNAGYWKNVTVKYSFNRWVNTYEYEAQHRCHSNDFRNIDQFEFKIDIPRDVDRIDFVVRYNVNGQEHWDNNGGKNYTIETDSVSTPQTIISLPHDSDFNEMRFY